MNADAVIDRFDLSDQGSFGRMWTRGLKLYSGELPYRDNKASISCVVAKFYRVVWAWSPRFRRFTYRLLDTDPRLGILEHPANFMGDSSLGLKCQLNGCIALGEKLGWMDNQKALLLSAPAVRRFESYMGHAPFLLEIRQ